VRDLAARRVRADSDQQPETTELACCGGRADTGGASHYTDCRDQQPETDSGEVPNLDRWQGFQAGYSAGLAYAARHPASRGADDTGQNDEGARRAWFEGYVAAECDADNRPYSDHPSAATWKPTRNPYPVAVRPSADMETLRGRRLAVDADGYVWWVNADDTWSMVWTNQDNTPIPQPVTYYEPARPSADTEKLFERVRRLIVDHGIRDDANGELFADRLDDVLRAALDGEKR